VKDKAGVVVSLLAGTAIGSGIGHDGIVNFENVVGGKGNDSITGDGGNNGLVGGAGADTIHGGAAMTP